MHLKTVLNVQTSVITFTPVVAFHYSNKKKLLPEATTMFGKLRPVNYAEFLTKE